MCKKLIPKTDCIFYAGIKPCIYHLKKGMLCKGCEHYRKTGKKEIEKRRKILSRLEKMASFKTIIPEKNAFKILIIKLGAPGDVLRTTPILKTLKEKYPSSDITWVSEKESLELLGGNPYIRKLIKADFNAVGPVLCEKYDLLLSFDKENFAIALATSARSKKKFGFKMDSFGALNIFNDKSAYALRLGIDNKLKFSDNDKTYQKIIYDMSELESSYGRYLLTLDKKHTRYGRKLLGTLGIRTCDIAIGLNTGAGKVFLTKKWPIDYFVKLSEMLKGIKNAKVILLGGPHESRINKLISKKTKGIAINTGTHHSKKEFAGIVDNCDIIVTSDTLCMHLAIARRKSVLALFGPTTEREVDLYGRGKKLYAKMPCSPCYKSRCSDTRCMKSILPEAVFKEIKKIVEEL